MLPIFIRDAIDQLLASRKRSELKEGVQRLQRAYRQNQTTHTQNQDDLWAYLAVRFPATFAVAQDILKRCPDMFPAGGSFLDIGAGPGVLGWAFSEWGFNFAQITLLEQDQEFASLGQKIASISANQSLKNANWLVQPAQHQLNLDMHDVVTCSYMLGENSAEVQEIAVRHAWSLTKDVLLLIEPGTPRGFNNILRAREILTQAKAKIMAPCPHQNRCPLAESDDWCHFSVRVERTGLHRDLKGGTLPFEDEKYSYLIVARHRSISDKSALIKSPIRRSGHTTFDLCTASGLKRLTLSKSDATYRKMKKSRWGDFIEGF